VFNYLGLGYSVSYAFKGMVMASLTGLGLIMILKRGAFEKKSQLEKTADKKLAFEDQPGAHEVFEGISQDGLWIKWGIYMSSGWIVATLVDLYFLRPALIYQLRPVYPLFVGVVFGGAIGVAQWQAAWRTFSGWHSWIWITILSWVIAEIGLHIFTENDYFYLVRIAFGGFVGTGQWLLLRRRFPQSKWWIPVCMGAWFIASLVYFMGLPFPYWKFFEGIIMACLTGLGLVQLLKHGSIAAANPS
jgi:hypothetical protein